MIFSNHGATTILDGLVLTDLVSNRFQMWALTTAEKLGYKNKTTLFANLAHTYSYVVVLEDNLNWMLMRMRLLSYQQNYNFDCDKSIFVCCSSRNTRDRGLLISRLSTQISDCADLPGSTTNGECKQFG